MKKWILPLLLCAAILPACAPAIADEPAVSGVTETPPAIPVATPAYKEGDVLAVGKDGKMTKVDLTKFQIQPVEWQAYPALWPGVEIGLRQDGTVLWRRK